MDWTTMVDRTVQVQGGRRGTLVALSNGGRRAHVLLDGERFPFRVATSALVVTR